MNKEFEEIERRALAARGSNCFPNDACRIIRWQETDTGSVIEFQGQAPSQEQVLRYQTYQLGVDIMKLLMLLNKGSSNGETIEDKEAK